MIDWWRRHGKTILQIFGTALAFALLIYLLEEEGWQEVLDAFRAIRPADLWLVAGLFFVTRIAVTARWYSLVRSAGVNMRFRDALSLTFTGLFASNFLPTTIGGDVVRLAGAMQMGFDRAISLASLAADRIVGMIGMSLFAPLGLYYSWSLIGSPAALSALPSFLRRPWDFFKRMLDSFSIWLKRPTSLLLSFAFTGVHMFFFFTAISVLARDLGDPISFWMIAGLWSLTYFITQVPISINGYGVQELSFTFLMSHVAGLSASASVTIAVLIRAYFLALSLPGAFFLPSVLATLARQKNEPPS